MSKEINKATFLVKSEQNNSFGTAFCIYRDEKGSYLLTCAHVVNACDKDSLIIGSYQKNNITVKYISKDEDLIDLAVIYIEGLLDSKVLALSTHEVNENDSFDVSGFRPHKSGKYAQEPLSGRIKKIYPLVSPLYEDVTIYDLEISNDDRIEKGYSGSAILINDKVVGVATDRQSNGKQAYAIPIKYLKKIWKDIPKDLFDINKEEKKQNIVEEIINDEKAPKEVREFSKKLLEYLYIIRKHPILSGIILIIFIGWTFPSSIYTGIKSFTDSNNSDKNIDGKEKKANIDKKVNKIKISLSGEVKNRNENQVYYLFREDDLDINTMSNSYGSFAFDDILGGHDKDERIFILCCKDKNQENCRKPSTECLIGESCEID